MKDSLQLAFIEETRELLGELEATLLAVEESPNDAELLAKLFRALHTIKGSSAMFGYDDIALFTHDIETAYDLIRNGKLKVTKQIIDLTLLARDEISNMLVKSDTTSQINEENTKKIVESFREIISAYHKADKPAETVTAKTKPETDKKPSAAQQLYSIKFTPGSDLFLSGTNPLLLIDELRGMGSLAVSVFIDKIPAFEDFNHEACYCYWEMLLRSSVTIEAIQDVFIFVSDACDLKIENITQEIWGVAELDFEKLQYSISAEQDYHSLELRAIVKNYSAPPEQWKRADIPAETKQPAQTAAVKTEADVSSSIRVSSEKLDELVNLVGELVTIQARLSQVATSNNNGEMISISEEVERITWSLRDSALNIRMLPIGSTFSKFKRLVRDLSKELGKEVELITEGAETELDKTVIEKLNDPLIHIIRNSIDHGVESPEKRTKQGKNRLGAVTLSASQSGGSVLIRIKDDGAGLDKEAIRAKAISQGLVNDNAELSEAEIFSMIFMAGFSTAKKVTSVSGRGVGMDVVKRAIDALRGNIEVQSEMGKGTTITLKLPLTLAIIEGLLVRVENDHYILPLSSVEECLELTQEDINSRHGRNLVEVRGSLIPYINLRKRFSIATPRPKIEQIVIAKVNDNSIGFVVDQVLGQHQTVLKSLGSYYKNVEGVSGATILGDGSVALILDINKLSENEESLENEFTNSVSFESNKQQI